MSLLATIFYTLVGVVVYTLLRSVITHYWLKHKRKESTMETSKTISIIAMTILGIVAYLWIGNATQEYFLPGFIEAKTSGEFGLWLPTPVATLIGMAWPISWSLWSVHYVAIHYTLAVLVSLFLLVCTWPVMNYGTQLAMHKKAHKVERLKRQNINKARLDELLRKEGMNLAPHNDSS